MDKRRSSDNFVQSDFSYVEEPTLFSNAKKEKKGTEPQTSMDNWQIS